MFEMQLFLGFPVDAIYASELEKVNPNLVSQYVQDSDDYLREVIQNELRFLGKNIGKIITLSQLELIEANIYSVLKKLVPDYPYEETPLYVFPIEHSST